MEVQVQFFGTFQILFLKGTFDDKDAQALRMTLERALRSKITHLLLDCKEVVGVSPAGLRLLLSYIQKFEQTKVTFVMFHLPADLLALVNSCGFDSVVKVTSSLEEALQIIKAKS